MQLTPVFTHTASEVFKLLSQIMLQIDTSLKKIRESLKCPMAKRLSLDQPNDSFAQSKEYICIIFHFMGLIRLKFSNAHSEHKNEGYYEDIFSVNLYLL